MSENHNDARQFCSCVKFPVDQTEIKDGILYCQKCQAAIPCEFKFDWKDRTEQPHAATTQNQDYASCDEHTPIVLSIIACDR